VHNDGSNKSYSGSGATPVAASTYRLLSFAVYGLHTKVSIVNSDDKNFKLIIGSLRLYDDSGDSCVSIGSNPDYWLGLDVSTHKVPSELALSLNIFCHRRLLCDAVEAPNMNRTSRASSVASADLNSMTETRSRKSSSAAGEDEDGRSDLTRYIASRVQLMNTTASVPGNQVYRMR
jgi:hypothetical protein